MRKLALLTSLLLVTGAEAPARAGWSEPIEVTWDAPVACSVACPDWIESYWTGIGVCDRHPLAPPESWDDVRFMAPSGGTRLNIHATIRPMIDYDLFLCLVRHPDTAAERWYDVTPRWVLIDDRCDNWSHPNLPVGCVEEFVTDVEPGATYVLRAYNFSDALSAPGSYRFYEF